MNNYKAGLLLFFTTTLFANYTNCNFKNSNYEDICNKVVNSGVSYEYANRFLLSYFKTKQFDEITWKLIQPSQIKYHREKEKKANNALVKYVPQMVENLKKYKDAYDVAQERYGVNREIIAAILLKETRLGAIKPKHDAFIVFNTILTRTNPKSSRERWLHKMSKTNMASIIEYCYKKEVTPEACTLPSSYAGAVGIPQFMPNSFIYADSYKGDVADLNTMEDAIISVAKFLHKKAGFNKLMEFEKIGNMPKIENDWYEYAFRHENASFVYYKRRNGSYYNCFTKDKPELFYLKEYVKKIMHYNNSSNYAVGVLRLAYDAHQELLKSKQ
jgi:membrane-bound lytic murein transglycosylase B